MSSIMRTVFSSICTFAAVAALLVSCNKQQVETPAQPEQKSDLVTVTIKAGAPTKTHLQVNGDAWKVIWQKNDAISIFANGTNYQFTTQNEGDYAEFTGEISEADLKASEFYALYPYDASATISEGVITTSGVKTGQNAVTGTFANGINQAVAKMTSLSETIEFKNVCSILRVVIPDDMNSLLKTVMISTNNNEKYVGGTAAITVSDEPTVALTGASADVQVNKNAGLEKGVYYFAVYPTAAAKGIRAKLIYVDGRTSEYIFNGKSFNFTRSTVFNVGNLKQQPTYMFENFEKESLPTYFTGNTNALKIVDNPFKTETNGSDKVLADDMHTATWGTSGYVQTAFGGDTVKEMFPYAARSKFTGVRFKIYIGGSDYYPRLAIDASASNGSKIPSKCNGEDCTADNYATLLKDNDWNVLEFNLASCGYTSPFNSNFGSLNNWQIKPFLNSEGKNCAATLSDTNAKLCYIDDIEFLY